MAYVMRAESSLYKCKTERARKERCSVFCSTAGSLSGSPTGLSQTSRMDTIRHTSQFPLGSGCIAVTM